MAATNRRDVLDSALLRPGRFDRIVNVPLPDLDSRLALFRQYLRNKQVEEAMVVDSLAQLTAGFSGADIKNLVNEAAILAARDGRSVLLQGDMEKALEKKTLGIVKEVETRSEDSLQRVAIHEAGHAAMVVMFRRYFDLRKVTIQATYSGAGGVTFFTELEKDGLYTRDMLHKRIVVALGGKAAEEVFYGRNFVSVGASQDLKQANDLARRMVSQFGMGEEARSVPLEGGWNTPVYSEQVRAKVDMEAAAIVEDCYMMAVRLLQGNIETTERVVDALRKRSILSGADIELLVLGNYTIA
jgi:cell division protease FtsH